MENTTVKRNEIEVPFVVRETKKGVNAGQKYLGIDWSKVNFDTLLNWAGVDEVFAIAKSKFDNRFKGIYDQATDEDDGTFNEEKWRTMAAGLSQTGESMADLKEALDEKNNEFLSLGDSQEDEIKALAIVREIKKLQAAINGKKRERAEKKVEEIATAPAVA